MIDYFMGKIKAGTGSSSTKIMINFFIDKIKYHITFKEYYEYNFYKIQKNKQTFVNNKINDKLIKKYNDKKLVYKIRNKNILYNLFKEYVKRKYFILTDENIIEFKKFLKSKSKIIVSKIDGYERDTISLSNISYDKLFLTLFESNVRLVEEDLIEDTKFKKFNLKSNFTLNYIVLKNKIILRTIKNNKVYYNIDDGKFNNKDIPYFDDIDSIIVNISKKLIGIDYVLIEVFPSTKGIELISINDNVPIIQNKEALHKDKSYYNKIKKYLE